MTFIIKSIAYNLSVILVKFMCKHASQPTQVVKHLADQHWAEESWGREPGFDDGFMDSCLQEI
jgi:hypothetical protein